jgi:hypothetical protein
VWLQLKSWLGTAARLLVGWLGVAAVLLALGLAAAWRLVRPYVIFALNVLAALLLLFEEWGWRPLNNLLAQLARFRIWAMAELWIAGLPPYGALVALGIPTAILVPAKLFGVYLLALGHIVSAVIVLVLAKLASTALIARIFILTKPALMQIGWFQRAYDIFVPWQEALFTWIRTSWVWRYGRVVKWRTRNFLRRSWTALRPRFDAAWADLRPRAIAMGRRLRAWGRGGWRRLRPAGCRLLQRIESLADLKRR